MNWLHHLYFGYVWPSCEGNGPESIVEIVIGVVVWQKILGPRYKAWHEREMQKHHDHILESVKVHLAAQKEKP